MNNVPINTQIENSKNHSNFFGRFRSIINSKIRERSQSLIVGIERNDARYLNPESDWVFEINDKVWIVGNELRIQVLLKEYAGEKL